MQRPWLKICVVVLSTAFACSSAPKPDTTGNTPPPTTPPPTPAAGACTTDSDCRLVADYCTGCDCRVLAKDDKDPTCDGPGVKCLADPCMTKTAACVSGTCTAKDKTP